MTDNRRPFGEPDGAQQVAQPAARAEGLRNRHPELDQAVTVDTLPKVSATRSVRMSEVPEMAAEFKGYMYVREPGQNYPSKRIKIDTGPSIDQPIHVEINDPVVAYAEQEQRLPKETVQGPLCMEPYLEEEDFLGKVKVRKSRKRLYREFRELTEANRAEVAERVRLHGIIQSLTEAGDQFLAHHSATEQELRKQDDRIAVLLQEKAQLEASVAGLAVHGEQQGKTIAYLEERIATLLERQSREMREVLGMLKADHDLIELLNTWYANKLVSLQIEREAPWRVGWREDPDGLDLRRTLATLRGVLESRR